MQSAADFLCYFPSMITLIEEALPVITSHIPAALTKPLAVRENTACLFLNITQQISMENASLTPESKLNAQWSHMVSCGITKCFTHHITSFKKRLGRSVILCHVFPCSSRIKLSGAFCSFLYPAPLQLWFVGGGSVAETQTDGVGKIPR